MFENSSNKSHFPKHCLKITRIWIFQFWNFHQFLAFWTFVHSKCRRSSLRSQCWIGLFLWFSNTVSDMGVQNVLWSRKQSTLERYGIFLSRLFCNVDLLWSKQQKQHFVGKTQSLFSHKQALQVMKCPLGAKAREIWSHIFPTTLEA